MDDAFGVAAMDKAMKVVIRKQTAVVHDKDAIHKSSLYIALSMSSTYFHAS